MRPKTNKKRGKQKRLGHRRRGAGNRGGRGACGWGKRGKQKKTKYTTRPRKKGFTSIVKKITKKINLDDIKRDVELKNFKVLGRGNLQGKFTIKASYFTQKAKEKIEKAGGKWVEI